LEGYKVYSGSPTPTALIVFCISARACIVVAFNNSLFLTVICSFKIPIEPADDELKDIAAKITQYYQLNSALKSTAREYNETANEFNNEL